MPHLMPCWRTDTSPIVCYRTVITFHPSGPDHPVIQGHGKVINSLVSRGVSCNCR